MAKELSPIYLPEAREIQGECGLFGAYLYDTSVNLSSLTYQAGTILQHRAEGAAGMCVSDGNSFSAVRELGTVAVALQEGRNMPKLENAHMAILHTRYPTAGTSNHRANTQPFSFDGIWFGHHGNLTNARQIEKDIGAVPKGDGFPDSDSWIALNAISRAAGSSLAEKVVNAQKSFEGGWAFIVSDGKSLIASRDPYGLRPLSFGVLGSRDNPQGYLLSVESCVFSNLPVSDFWEILPGETIKIDKSGVETVEYKPQKTQMSCIFEFIYMMRPDSIFLGKQVSEVRRRAGNFLWEDAPIELDGNKKLVVMPVPDSGRSAAIGFFQKAQEDLRERVTYDEGLLSNRYFGRNFIKSTSERAAYLKFYTIPVFDSSNAYVIVDDSIVRGDTMPDLVSLCQQAGAWELHIRVNSPPILHPCLWGVAMANPREFFANKIPDLRERERFLGVDSLRHLSLDRLIEATRLRRDMFCTHCLDGNGPPLGAYDVIPLLEIAKTGKL